MSNQFQQQPQFQQPYYPPPPPPPLHNNYAAPPPPNMQSQNYAQQQPQHSGKNQQMDYGYRTEKFAAIKPKWNDVFFLLLFLAQLGGFVALSVISLRALGASETGGNGLGTKGGTSNTLTAAVAYLLAIIAGFALVLAILLLFLVKRFTTAILEISLVLSVLMSIGYAVLLYIEKSYAAAIIFTLFAIFAVIVYFPMRKRIPFTRQLLLFVLRIASEYKSVYYIAILGALIQTIYSVYWSFAVVSIYEKFTPGAPGANTSGGTPSNATVIGLMVFSVFSFYWTSQFILNYFLVVEAGIFGTFYFQGSGTKKVASGSFKRASTYSSGSIAFGSLIVAILDTLKAIFQLLQNYESGQGDMIGAVVACIATCCIGCIASLVEYFNRYAFIEISLYGKPYIKAAKDTWRLFRDRGITALVNDSLVNSIWTFGSIANGGLCSAFAFIYLFVSNPSYVQQNPGIKSAVIGYAFIIGFFITHTLGYGALSSGVSTIFVGLAEDPQALADRDPALFELIRQTYPAVVTSV